MTNRHYFDPQDRRYHSDVEPDSDIEERVALPQPNPNEWFRVKRVLAHRRCKGKDEYLLEWADGSEPTWIPRRDVSDPLIQMFYASTKYKRRIRR